MARPPSVRTLSAAFRIRSSPPPARMRAATSSHSCPGPNLGYRKRSIRLVSVAGVSRRERAGTACLSMCSTALRSDKALMRWAPNSALISSHGTPHTFSVYDLKNVR